MVTFRNPPINMFVPMTIVELGALMTDLEADPSVAAGRREVFAIDGEDCVSAWTTPIDMSRPKRVQEEFRDLGRPLIQEAINALLVQTENRLHHRPGGERKDAKR